MFFKKKDKEESVSVEQQVLEHKTNTLNTVHDVVPVLMEQVKAAESSNLEKLQEKQAQLRELQKEIDILAVEQEKLENTIAVMETLLKATAPEEDLPKAYEIEVEVQ